MKYLNAFVQEVLRLYTPVTAPVERKAIEAHKIEVFNIKKG